MKLGIAQINNWCNGKIIKGDPNSSISGISIDSRTINEGELFVAIKGERHDGHRFINTEPVNKAGAVIAAAAWVEQTSNLPNLTIIEVDDTLTALQNIAHNYRLQFRLPCIAITGANGKTTTKDLMTQILSSKNSVLATSGNLNNHIGVPLTLLNLEPGHQLLVVEIGMNHLGEIDRLAGIVEPSVGVITNVGPVHLEFLETIENVYRAKLELADHVETLFVNGDDQNLVMKARQKCPKIITFGFSAECDIRAKNLYMNGRPRTFFTVDGVLYELSLPGRHNVFNALGAIAVGVYFQYPVEAIVTALKDAKITGLRSEVIKNKDYTILNDTYNANPVSMVSSITMLKDFQSKGRRIAVLGDMFELGANSTQFHYRLGQQIGPAQLDYLITIGLHADAVKKGAIKSGMIAENIISCESPTRTADIVNSLIQPGDVVLIKGSRGMQMEGIVKQLTIMENKESEF